jgi:tRNA (guanine-N7-)-methyltransferase
LKRRQAELMEALLPHLAADVSAPIDVDALFHLLPRGGGEGLEAPWGALSMSSATELSSECSTPPSSSRQGGGNVVLEIGFGGGEHLVAQATAHPERRFIGVEPFVNGVASCLRHIEENGVTNVRLHHGDVRNVLARLPDASLDCVYILFPDPWPKKRHWKRRLIQREFVVELARVLRVGGEVRFATDWANYAAWTLEAFTKAPHFTWMADRAIDWQSPWPGHVSTRYEQKRLGDCSPVYLRFRKEGSI